jgi:hypothetical protein
LTGHFVGRAANGVIRGESGVKGDPGWTAYDGTIESDGSTTINVDGLSGESRTDPFHRPTGSEFSYKMVGVLDGAAGTATRDNRDCNITLAKQSERTVAAKPTGLLGPRSPVASDLPQADGLFTEEDMQRVRAIAGHDALTNMPRFKIERPDSKIPVGLRRFVGIWASDVGFNSGRGRQAMWIVTNVEAPGRATGYYVWGAPTAQQTNQSPAGIDPFEAKVTGDQLTFQVATRYSVIGTLTSGGNLSIVQKHNDGRLSYITLKPLWRLLDAEHSAKR